MLVRLWGTRGSIPTPGPETTRYGGNTACVEVRARDGSLLILDAGTGIRRWGTTIGPTVARVDILLTHLHLDHIMGLGFCAPLYRPGVEAHIWGPASTTQGLRERLGRYLSPPLFPVRLTELPCRLVLHDVPRPEPAEIGSFRVASALVCHPGPTVGYRISADGATLAYLPDHEPALGLRRFPLRPQWTSGFGLAEGVDLLIHDAQYSVAEYPARVGWGHSSTEHVIRLAELAGVRHLVPFHHDPARTDDELDRLYADALETYRPVCRVTPAVEGDVFELGG